MPADPQKARELFLHAVGKLPPEQWDAYLAEGCGPDAELRQQVAHLLQVHREAGSFLERPAEAVGATGAFAPAPEGPPAVPTEAVGTTIGPYKLIQVIGEGGMGTVWMAQQTAPVKRLVAVKVIKPGMDSKQVLARFEAERQALALMDHPHIARVLDAGTTAAGRPFFVMELVKGVPITRYCDEHRLTPKQRLELFIPVSQAVQHAHQKGIIHRDIKPSNVLVALYDGKPVPKVIDFGIAKATGQQLTEHTLVTGFGVVVGTLEYMSPEQAELNQLDIDTRSDIYSLGVLLYELLTGTTPLEKKRLKEAALLEVLRVIREEEPPRPSTRLSESKDSLPSISAQRQTEPAKLTKLVRGDLDWIVMKALEKDRNRRYETANGLVMDLQRYLADEPVQACPPSTAYRLRKFARRNKAALVTVGFVAAALLLGAVVSVWQAVRASSALTAERKAHEALDAARAAQDEQRAHANQDLSAALEEVAGLREKARLAGPGDTPAWRQLREAVRRAEALAGSELADAVLVRRVQALAAELTKGEADRRMMTRLDEIRFNQGLLQGGRVITASGGTRPSYEAAFKEYGLPVFDLDPEEAARRIAASPIRDWLVAALDDCASNNGPLIRQLLPIARRVYHEDPWRRQYYDARIRLDHLALSRLMQQPEALAQPPALLCVLPFSMEFLRRVQKQHPGDVWVNHRLANHLMGVGPFDAWDCVAFRRAALAARPESPVLRVALDEALYHLHATRGDYHVGARQWDRAVIEYSKAVEMDPKNASALWRRVNAYEQLGQWDKVAADAKKAVELAPEGGHSYLARFLAACPEAKLRDPSRAIELAKKDLQLHPSGYLHAYSWYTLGVAHYRAGDWEAAIAALDKHRELNGGEDAQDWLFLAMAHRKLGHVVESQNAYERALRCLDQISEQLYRGWEQAKGLNEGISHVRREAEEVLGLKGNPTDVTWFLPRPDEAVAVAGEWVRAQPRSAEPLLRRAELYQRLDRGEEALADLSRATEVDPSCGPTVWARQAALYTRLRQWDKAVAAYSKLVERGPDALYGRANAYLQLGQWDKAAEDYTRLIVLYPGASGQWHGRGVARSSAGRYEEAVAAFSRAIDLSPAYWLAWHNRGLALARLGRWERAAADQARALELQPRDDWKNDLAWLLATCSEAKVRNPARAVALAQQAADANPKVGTFWNTLGVARYRAGDFKGAVEALDRSVALRQGGDPYDWLFLAMAHWQLGDKDEARKRYDRAVERMSMNEELLRFRTEAAALMGTGHPLPPFAEVRKAIDQAHALAGQGKWQKAAAEYARVADAFPGEAGLWLEYASALLLADDPEGYRRACADIHRRLGAATDPDTCYGLARIASLAPGGGDPAQAVQRAEKGVAAHAKQAWYLHTLAVAHYRAGQFDQAVRRAEQSLKDDPAWPGHVADWLLLAMAHQRLGHGDEAREWLDKAVQWIDRAGKGLPRESRFALPVPSWGDRLEIQLLRREAEKLIGGQ